MTDVLSLEAAEVRIDGRVILGPVDLTVAPGQHWVLLGPNGSGKTTLLTLAGAWRQPTRGTVTVLGERLGSTDVRRLRRRIGHVSHAVADRLRPELRVLDVVVTGKAATLERWWLDVGPADEAAARAALEAVGCAALAERQLGTCSMGERQRVLIARALFGEHPLLLLDEPAAGLDLPARERLLHAMTSASRPGTTTVLATHHLEEVPPTITHVALLREGSLLSSGRVEDVLEDGTLSDCYGIDVVVERRGGRWTARAR